MNWYTRIYRVKESKIPQETITKIIEMYQSLMSPNEISRTTGVNSATVLNILRRNNIPVRSLAEANRIARQKQMQDPEYRKRRSELSKKQMQNPAYFKRIQEKSKEYWSKPENAQRHKEELQRRAQDPSHRKNLSDKQRARMQNPELRQHLSDLAKKQWEDPAFVQMHSDKLKSQWADPEFANLSAKNSSEFMKKYWADRGGFYEYLSTLPKEKQDEYIWSVSFGPGRSREDAEKAFYPIRQTLDNYIKQKQQNQIVS